MNYHYLINKLINPKIINIRKMAPARFFIDIEPLRGDKSFLIEVTFCEASGPNSLPELWYKNGYMDKIFKRYMCIQTYCTDKDGNCTGSYNPQIIGIHKLNFDYILESTEENLNNLIGKCVSMYERNEVRLVEQNNH